MGGCGAFFWQFYIFRNLVTLGITKSAKGVSGSCFPQPPISMDPPCIDLCVIGTVAFEEEEEGQDTCFRYGTQDMRTDRRCHSCSRSPACQYVGGGLHPSLAQLKTLDASFRPALTPSHLLSALRLLCSLLYVLSVSCTFLVLVSYLVCRVLSFLFFNLFSLSFGRSSRCKFGTS